MLCPSLKISSDSARALGQTSKIMLYRGCGTCFRQNPAPPADARKEIQSKMAKKVLFISYHGGQGDDSRSSFPKAEKLKRYLEERGIPCFLCKDECRGDDYYDAINEALLECRHFVLVAEDGEMLTQWVKEEIKRFDILCLNGEKPNCFFSAYIFGKITEKDLCDFSPTFKTKDIVKGDGGFEVIYRGILTKSTEEELAFFDKSKKEAPALAEDGETFASVSMRFLDEALRYYESFDSADYIEHCKKVTDRVRAANPSTVPKNCENYIDHLYNKITERGGKYLFKLLGTTGTQKSYILRLLYIKFRREMSSHAYDPVYMHYGRLKEEIRRAGETPAKYFEKLFCGVKAKDGRKPLFLVDGVQNVITDNRAIDSAVNDLITKEYPTSSVIVSVTEILRCNHARKSNSSLFTTKANFSITLHRASIYEKADCIDYLATFEQFDSDDIEELYDVIYKSGVLYLDEHIANLFYENEYIDKSNPNIMEVFERPLREIADDDDELFDKCAKAAFIFAYDKSRINFEDKILVKFFDRIDAESAYLDCLIAAHWISELKHYSPKNEYEFFQTVMPKDITRFITASIRADASECEPAILQLGKKYNEMSVLGKSEMSFYLGRITLRKHSYEAIRLLEDYYAQTKEEIKKKRLNEEHDGITYSLSDKRTDLFLLRGLAVSLIYCGNSEVLWEYIHSLISDDLCNAINRGFHLEYYGDKTYNPTQDSLDYEDKPTTGERTLRLLCDSIEKKLSDRNPKISLVLDVFTAVSLLQARIEISREKVSFNMKTYLERVIKLTERFLKKMNIKDNIIRIFFKMALADFDKALDNPTPYDSKRDICSTYLHASDVKRTGWVNQRIPFPESISEHMYSCWLIALVNLPETDESTPEYNKKRILDMLLIHDLAETKLGDIPKPDKERDEYRNYPAIENETALSIFLKGTYSQIDSMDTYVKAWDEWYKRETPNAKIAKDIDTIQAIYQALDYYGKFPECFDEERLNDWIDECKDVTTAAGELILERLITNNPRFAPIIKKYNES